MFVSLPGFVAAGRLGPVAYRLWKLSDPRATAAISRALAAKKILIADGHHRYEVGRRHYAATRAPEAAAILAYLCPEEDQGLVVLPTHRIVREGSLAERAKPDCRVRPCGSLTELLTKLSASRNPYSFGLCNGRFSLAEPLDPAGCRSGLCVEWLGRRLLAEVPPDQISYTPDAQKAVSLARKERAAAVLVKPFRVSQIRTAVAAVGLLPPKSTYFYPKVATGLVFNALERPRP
jgi:hypothetical protein